MVIECMLVVNGLEQSSTEGGSLQILRCSQHVMWFHCVWSMSGSTKLLISMHEKIPKKLHVQVFLRMNTCLFETCQRLYNWIKSLKKLVCILLVLITYVHTTRSSKDVKLTCMTKGRFTHSMPRPCHAPIVPCPLWKSAWQPEISELLVPTV